MGRRTEPLNTATHRRRCTGSRNESQESYVSKAFAGKLWMMRYDCWPMGARIEKLAKGLREHIDIDRRAPSTNPLDNLSNICQLQCGLEPYGSLSAWGPSQTYWCDSEYFSANCGATGWWMVLLPTFLNWSLPRDTRPCHMATFTHTTFKMLTNS